MTAESYSARNDRSVAGDILDPSQLIEKEREALRAFFGGEVPVVTPPSELIETQKVAEAKGFGILVPLYFPAVEFKQASRYPGWRVKPGAWYWNQIREGRISNDAAKFGGYWGLFDKSRRPNYNGGRQMFKGDPLAPILAQARKEGRIDVPDSIFPENNVPEGSRFDVTLDEQDQVVFPQLAKILRLTENVAMVRRPTEMEFNFAGNLRHLHLSEAGVGEFAGTCEWLDDKFEGAGRLIGDNSDCGCFAHFPCFLSDFRYDFIAFRPLVVFLHN